MFPIHDDTERLHGRPYLNYSLIAINGIVFIWEISVTGFFSNPVATETLFQNYGAVPESVLGGNIASVITSMFMHGGIVHIIGNMVFLFVFGDNLEDKFGRIKYLLMYIGWGICCGSHAQPICGKCWRRRNPCSWGIWCYFRSYGSISCDVSTSKSVQR